MKLSKMDASKIVPGIKVSDTLLDGPEASGVIIAVVPGEIPEIKKPQGPLIIIDYVGGRQQKIRHAFTDTLIVPD